jgi:hypothetical protein
MDSKKKILFTNLDSKKNSKKKGNLWVFGDSYSTLAHYTIITGGKEYLKHGAGENDKSWFDHLNKKLDLNLIQNAAGGWSNDHIFDIVIENIDNMKREDVVIINTSFNDRIYIPNKHNQLVDYPVGFQIHPYDFEKDVVKLLDRYRAMFCEYDFEQRSAFSQHTEKRFKFLKNVMDNYVGVKSCVLWSVYGHWNNPKFESVITATNKKVMDHHWSYKGHFDFFKYIEKEYEKNICRKNVSTLI